MTEEEKEKEEKKEEDGGQEKPPSEKEEEKSELQITLEEEREKNRLLNNERIGLGRTVKSLEEKVDNLTQAFQQKPLEPENSGEGRFSSGGEEYTDDEYITKKSLEGEKKKWQAEEEARFGEYEQKKQDKTNEYNTIYSKEFAKLSMEIEDNDTVNEIAKEHDVLFVGKKEPTGNPEFDARIHYAESKSAYISKAAAAGKELPFKGKTPVAALGVGGDGAPIKREKEVNYNLSDSAKEYLAATGKSGDKEFMKRAMAK